MRAKELKIEVGGKVVELKGLIGKKRIVIVSGDAEKVREVVRGKGSEDKKVVVVVVGGDGKRLGVGGKAGKGVGKVEMNSEKLWKDWLDEERFDVKESERINDVLVTVVERDGKVNRLPKGQTDW